jgi:glucose/arabinose dehydrogenase
VLVVRLIQRFIFCVLILFLPITARAQQYVVDTLAVNPNIAFPVSIAFSPDNGGKFFFTEKNNGRVRIFDQGALRPTPFTTVAVVGSGEQGLLGVALHPDYPDSPFVYIFYTRSSDAWNVVVRYRDSASIGVQPVTILVNPHTASNHNGGNIHFGPDRKLYVTLGDNASSGNSQDSSATNLHGKILRLNFDGSTPFDNPWPDKKFWSVGHRNSFDFTFDAQTGKMYCSENGPSCDDELNRVPRGANMGWPIEGNCAYTNNPTYVRPLYYFPGPGLPALTGIAVYRATAFPRLRGKILFTGNSSPNVWTLTLSADGDTIIPNSFSTFFTYSTGFADIEVGPDGSLYLANGPYSANRILRLRPAVPTFSSSAPTTATQGALYSYTPTFNGTPPGLRIILGPEGMYIDSTTWTVHWIPTNQQALQHQHNVLLRAENGAGFADQQYTVVVTNVNDPPGPFGLVSPPGDTTLNFVGSDPAVHFVWQASIDPDLDTVRYTLEIDTVSTFNSSALRDTLVGTATSKTLTFQRRSANYYWRVLAFDGQLTIISSEYRRVIVTFTTPVKEEKPTEGEYGLEQNFPNPFNPATNIVYVIPKSGHVRLAVYNLLGQEVALVFEGLQNAGTHDVEFRNFELPSGIYFYRIQAHDYVETKKLTILR